MAAFLDHWKLPHTDGAIDHLRLDHRFAQRQGLVEESDHDGVRDAGALLVTLEAQDLVAVHAQGDIL